MAPPTLVQVGAGRAGFMLRTMLLGIKSRAERLLTTTANADDWHGEDNDLGMSLCGAVALERRHTDYPFQRFDQQCRSMAGPQLAQNRSTSAASAARLGNHEGGPQGGAPLACPVDLAVQERPGGATDVEALRIGDQPCTAAAQPPGGATRG